MAQKNRLNNRVGAGVVTYLVLGSLIGTALGFATNTLLSATSKAHFEASIVLFRTPIAGTQQAARDFISAALHETELIDRFAKQHGSNPKIRRVLSKNLRVVARDASSPNAEIKLFGKDPTGLEETLDALALFLSENLRTIEESELQNLMSRLNREIDIANTEYLNLIGQRSKHNELNTPLKDVVRNITQLLEHQLDIELTRQYNFDQLPVEETEQTKARVAKLTEDRNREKQSGLKLAEQHGADFEFVTSLSLTEAKLRKLRQIKQHLVIEFNQGTPLRVTGRAKIGMIDAQSPPTNLILGASALIGMLLAGTLWSFLQSRGAMLTAPAIERRLLTEVMASIPQALTDFGAREGYPMAARRPLSVAVASVKSFATSLHFFADENDTVGPIVFCELGQIHHSAHLISNYAVVLAAAAKNVLVIDRAASQLSAMLSDGAALLREKGIVTQDHLYKSDVEVPRDKGSICFTTAIAESSDQFSLYDSVLILSPDPADAKNVVENCSGSVGFVVCNTKSRISRLRRALGNALHGVVVCGHPLEESVYGN